MKTLTALLLTTALSGTAFAQSLEVNPNGNVGIGTPSPSAKLSITNGDDARLNLFSNGGSVAVINAVANTNATVGRWLSINPTGGEVGIGTYTPSAKLSITNGDDARLNLFSNGGSIAVINSVANTNASVGRWLSINPSGGDVAIGTYVPTHKLTVNGQIRAKGFIMDANNWSDYVFADNYKLASLDEVEKHIKKNRHLPGVPSEAELVSKGLDLGKMSAVQMAKIEELMLHVIALNKKMEAQAEQVKAQAEEIRLLKTPRKAQ